MTDIATVGPVTIGDYLAILRRQKWLMLMVGVTILTLAATLVAYWPATYRSAATILIRPVVMPVNFIRSTATSFAEERVKAILQRIITTQNLTAIIEKYRSVRSRSPVHADDPGRRHYAGQDRPVGPG